MPLPGLPMPEPPVSGQKRMVQKRKEKAKGKAKRGSALSDIGGDTGGLAEAIEAQAAAQAQKARSKSGLVDTGALDPFAQLQQDLFAQYGGINVAPTPLEQLRQMAEEQVAAQFDPMIQLLQSQMGQKIKRGERSQSQAREMYNALGADILAELPAMTKQFAAEDAEANTRYDSAQKLLQQQYGKQSDQQQAVLQQLGIQAAAPEASQQAMEDQKYFQSQFEGEQQAALNALAEQQRAAQTYQTQLGSSSRMAGENTAQDIRSALEDYLDQANVQMSGLQSQRGAALASLLQQMQSQDAQRIQQEEQQQFENLMALSRFQLDAAKASADQAGTGGPQSLFGDATTGLPGAQNFLAEKYPDQPILASGLMEQIQDVLGSKLATQGKFILEPGDPATGRAARYSDVGQEMLQDLLRREIERENQAQPGRYGNMDINTAIAALQAYFGKVR